MKGALHRMWDSPRLIPVLAALTVAALLTAGGAVIGVLILDNQQERDRIASDIASCERGNIGRTSDIRIARATEHLIQGIIDKVLPAGSSVRVDKIRDDLEPLFQTHREAVAQIRLVECTEVVPGVSPRSTTTEGN